MTADRRAALVDNVRDLVNFFCDTPCGDGEYCGCRKDAEKAIDLIRAEVLEEAARVADDLVLAHPGRADLTAIQCAAAIRALKEK